MDLATRKRFLSGGIEAPAPKMVAVSQQDQLMSFADIMTFQLLNAITNTEQTQRCSLLDDLISRIQWLKQQLNEQDAKFKKPEESKNISNQVLDPKQMQINIQKQIEMLQNMAKVFRYSAQLAPFPPTPPSAPAPALHKKISAPGPVVTSVTAPALPIPPVLPPVLPPAPLKPPPTITVQEGSKKSPPLPLVKIQEPPKQENMIPTNTKPMSAEEYVIDLQNKQKKLLSYIESAHGGKVTDDVLHDYLKHSYVLLKENGVVRAQPNPFYHLMNPSVANAAASFASSQMVPSPMKMSTPTPSHVQRKPETPIPAPPVLVAQVELPQKRDPETPKKELSSPPNEKVSPPPQLAPQTPLEITSKWVAPTPFETPATRPCNQWSVFSMALPLRLICRCHPRPCTCLAH